jgi:hypothetical protein
LARACPRSGSRFAIIRPRFTVDTISEDLHYDLEEQRGYPADGNTWSPGYYKLDLGEREQVTFIASTESPAGFDALTPNAAWDTEARATHAPARRCGKSVARQP